MKRASVLRSPSRAARSPARASLAVSSPVSRATKVPASVWSLIDGSVAVPGLISTPPSRTSMVNVSSSIVTS
jgi:hypothetical protein